MKYEIRDQKRFDEVAENIKTRYTWVKCSNHNMFGKFDFVLFSMSNFDI